MSLPLSVKCIRFCLYSFNFLLAVTGLILIIVGSVIKTPYSAYHYILDHGFFAIPVLLIFVGVIIFVVSFFGFYGPYKKNYCMTITFGVFLVLVFILEISGGIAGYAMKGKVSNALKNDLEESIVYYKNSSTDVKNMWDIAQSNFHCCGATKGPSDWNGTIPNSCCPKNVPKCTDQLAYKTSCFGLLENFFKSSAGALGGAAIGIAVIQLLGIIFAYVLASSIEKQYDSLEKD